MLEFELLYHGVHDSVEHIICPLHNTFLAQKGIFESVMLNTPSDSFVTINGTNCCESLIYVAINHSYSMLICLPKMKEVTFWISCPSVSYTYICSVGYVTLAVINSFDTV